jgi:hypothetical protein
VPQNKSNFSFPLILTFAAKPKSETLNTLPLLNALAGLISLWM